MYMMWNKVLWNKNMVIAVVKYDLSKKSQKLLGLLVIYSRTEKYFIEINIYQKLC